MASPSEFGSPYILDDEVTLKGFTTSSDPEKTPITVEEEVRPMTWREIEKATNIMLAAFLNDPVQHYMRDTPDSRSGTFFEWRKKQMFRMMLTRAVAKGEGFTINAEGFVVYHPPPDSETEHISLLDRLIIRLAKVFRRLTSFGLTKEQRKRQAEVEAKVNTLVDHVIGDRSKSLMLLGELFTDPDKQGHGYGTRLVKHITDMADAASRTVWLSSSNINNTAFYQSCGFSVVGEYSLGDDNPSWTEAPVVVRIMIKEFKESQPRKEDELI